MIPTKNDQQLALNKTLVEQSGGLLAPLSGKERFVSVGTSHTCAFFRAAQANCKPPESCKGDIAADARCSAAPQRGGAGRALTGSTGPSRFNWDRNRFRPAARGRSALFLEPGRGHAAWTDRSLRASDRAGLNCAGRPLSRGPPGGIRSGPS